MKWKKLGFVWGPDGSHAKMVHSALQPTPVLLNEDVIRVYFGVRDDSGVSRVSYVDLSANDPTEVLGIASSPALNIGEPGCFDENGVVPCAVIRLANKLRLYYAGYMCPMHARFIAFSGVAESDDGGNTFKRLARVPIIDRTDNEPLFRVIHSIIIENGRWRAWYGAGGKFITGASKTLPAYNIRYMESCDGMKFPNYGEVVLDLKGSEYRVGRPNVFKSKTAGYIMFYGYGSEAAPYKLGFAESRDGYSWVRNDGDIGLNLSKSGWDSEMMAYPAVIETRSGTYLFYNGNSYGRAGFGAALLETDI
jgi:hypothetical protein